MSIEGVDYAFSQPSAAALVAAGKHFACRYGGPGSSGKQLTAGELAALTAAGIAVVANAEGTADGLKGGYDTGRSWAASADAYFRRLGMPAGRPIYLSADWDAHTASDLAAIDAAMDGAASVLGRARVGVYGGYDVIKHLAGNGKAKWFWQTYAWSESYWYPAAHIQQYRNGVTIGGADCDLNRAMVADYGQWPIGEEEPMGNLYRIKEGGAGYDAKIWYYAGEGRRHVPDTTVLKELRAFGAVDVAVSSLAVLDLVAPQPAAPVPADLAARLQVILAAALDDGNVTVTADDATKTELAAIRDQLAAVPAQTVAALGAELAG